MNERSTTSRSMQGKVCLVTGGTSGIGEATARGLAALGARVLVHGRSGEKCERTVREIVAATGNPHVEAVRADLSSLDEVRALAQEVSARTPRLDVLVNNAGLMGRGGASAPGSVDQVFVVNQLAPFLLTHLLLDRLKASAPARIVNVASMMHRFARVEVADVPIDGPYTALRGYNCSKLALILSTRVLARRLEGSGVVVNALHPGAVRSGGLDRGRGGSLVRALLWFMQSPNEGARTSLYLATSPDAARVSGQYFVKCQQAPVARRATDDALAERVWQVSARLTGLPA